MSLKKCNKCGLPETYETLIIGEDGVCNICNQSRYKRESIDWTARHKMLEDLANEYRGKYDYDCIVPFSGGKDSTYTLWYLVTQLKLKPLVVQFDHGFMRDTLKNNNQKTFKKLGVDVLSFSPNWKLVKRLMLESLRRKGDFCWHCHTGIFSYPMHIALKFNVPLVFWGEPSAEYAAYYHYSDDQIEEVDEERFHKFTNLGIAAEDMYGMIKGDFNLSERDLLPYTYPKLKDLKKLGYRSVCLGSFIPWNVKENFEIIRNELGWVGEQVEGMPWDIYPYEKIECFMQGTRDYIKYLKRGYSRVTQMTALDARRGNMSLEDAGKLINQYEGKKPPSLELFLEYVGLTENEFNEIVKTTCVPPHTPDFNIQEVSEKTWDFEKWFREKI